MREQLNCQSPSIGQQFGKGVTNGHCRGKNSSCLRRVQLSSTEAYGPERAVVGLENLKEKTLLRLLSVLDENVRLTRSVPPPIYEYRSDRIGYEFV